MREREGEKPVDIFNVESQRLVNGCHPLERPDLQPARDKDLMPVTQICSLTWDNFSWQDWRMARESRRGVLPYLKQQRKLNFLVGKNIQLWLARLQTRCKHAVCCLWPARAVLVLTVSIKLETLMEQNCLDCLRWDITRLIYLNVNQLIRQTHSRIQQLL